MEVCCHNEKKEICMKANYSLWNRHTICLLSYFDGAWHYILEFTLPDDVATS